MKSRNICLMMALVVVLGTVSFGAETVHLFLTGKSQGWIKGESTQISLWREDSIEAVAYTQMVVGEPDPKTGITGLVRNHFPVTILKRLDNSTPQLFLAWRNHEPLTAVFKFYRPNPSGDGTTQHFYTVTLRGAFISGIRREVLNAMDPQTAMYPPVERISFTYNEIEEVWEDGGFSVGDEWHADTSKIPLSDVNFDGIVNMNDFAILADEWMTQY